MTAEGYLTVQDLDSLDFALTCIDFLRLPRQACPRSNSCLCPVVGQGQRRRQLVAFKQRPSNDRCYHYIRAWGLNLESKSSFSKSQTPVSVGTGLHWLHGMPLGDQASLRVSATGDLGERDPVSGGGVTASDRRFDGHDRGVWAWQRLDRQIVSR